MAVQKILIKRRKTGAAGPPSTLLNGELGFNEVNQVLYYGSGDDGSGIATSINPIAGGYTSLLENATLSTFQPPLYQSDDYLIININGTQRAIRLYDV